MSEVPLRADAEARRLRIIAEATRLFVDEGLDVPMERVAHDAEVGIGTLYRRFPNRDALLAAVATESLVELRDLMQRPQRGESSAWDVLVAMVTDRERIGLGLRGRLAENPDAARSLRENQEVRAVQREVNRALRQLVAAAQAEGALRNDIGDGDVALLMYVIGRAKAPLEAPDRTEDRLRSLLLDALTPKESTMLSGESLTIADIWPPAD